MESKYSLQTNNMNKSSVTLYEVLSSVKDLEGRNIRTRARTSEMTLLKATKKLPIKVRGSTVKRV